MSSWTPHFFWFQQFRPLHLGYAGSGNSLISTILKFYSDEFSQELFLLRIKYLGDTFLDTTILSNQVSITIYPLYRFLLFHVTFISFNNTRLWVGLLTRIGSTLFKKKNNFKRTQKIDSFFLTLLSLLRFKDLPTQKDVKWLWYEKYVSLSLPNSPEPFSVSLRTPATPQSR